MNYKALLKLNYGLQIIATHHEGQKAGYIANTCFQVTSHPVRMAISAHKDNLTTDLILSSKVFSVSVLAKNVNVSLIGRFGFETSSEVDKFEGLDIITSHTGAPIILNDTTAWFDCRVIQSIDLDSHYLIIGEVQAMDLVQDVEPLTYAYYREHYKLLAPKNAPTYISPEKLKPSTEHPAHTKENMVRVQNTWVCTICGYVYDPAEGDPSQNIEPGTAFEDLPDSYRCPVCNAGKDFFQLNKPDGN